MPGSARQPAANVRAATRTTFEPDRPAPHPRIERYGTNPPAIAVTRTPRHSVETAVGMPLPLMAATPRQQQFGAFGAPPSIEPWEQWLTEQEQAIAMAAQRAESWRQRAELESMPSSTDRPPSRFLREV